MSKEEKNNNHRFDPMILTKEADANIKLFEESGFERRHKRVSYRSGKRTFDVAASGSVIDPTDRSNEIR